MKKVVIIFNLLFVFFLANCSDETDYKNLRLDTNAQEHHEEIDMDAEKNYTPDYADIADGDIDDHNTTPDDADKILYRWPCDLSSVGHTIASYQNYSRSPYFHHGIDIRCDAGADIYASAGGKIINIENYQPSSPAYWEVAILDNDGFIWQYHHVDKNSIPQAIHDAYKSKTPIEAGVKIGEVYYWPVVTYGERFHHIHLNVLGAGKTYVNPLTFLDKLPDTQIPDIVDIGILKNGKKYNSNSINGSYSIYAKVHDLILHDKFSLPVYHLGYTVDSEPYRVVWQFDKLPGGSSNTKYVHDYYVSSMTCGNYSCRELTVDLSFSPTSTITFPKTKGQHQITVTAKDFYGNEATKNYEWTVK